MIEPYYDDRRGVSHPFQEQNWDWVQYRPDKYGSPKRAVSKRVAWAVAFCERAYWRIYRAEMERKKEAKRKEVRRKITTLEVQMAQASKKEAAKCAADIAFLEKRLAKMRTVLDEEFKRQIFDAIVSRAALRSGLRGAFIRKVWVGDNELPNGTTMKAEKHKLMPLKDRNEVQRLLKKNYDPKEIAALMGYTVKAICNVRDIMPLN